MFRYCSLPDNCKYLKINNIGCFHHYTRIEVIRRQLFLLSCVFSWLNSILEIFQKNRRISIKAGKATKKHWNRNSKKAKQHRKAFNNGWLSEWSYVSYYGYNNDDTTMIMILIMIKTFICEVSFDIKITINSSTNHASHRDFRVWRKQSGFKYFLPHHC